MVLMMVPVMAMVLLDACVGGGVASCASPVQHKAFSALWLGGGGEYSLG